MLNVQDCLGFRHFHQVCHLVDHASHCRRVFHFHGLMHAPEAQAHQAGLVLGQGADGSSTSTAWRIRLRPRPVRQALCFFKAPMGLFTSVTFTFLSAMVLSLNYTLAAVLVNLFFL